MKRQLRERASFAALPGAVLLRVGTQEEIFGHSRVCSPAVVFVQIAQPHRLLQLPVIKRQQLRAARDPPAQVWLQVGVQPRPDYWGQMIDGRGFRRAAAKFSHRQQVAREQIKQLVLRQPVPAGGDIAQGPLHQRPSMMPLFFQPREQVLQ